MEAILSALNVCVTANAVHIFTDAASYDASTGKHTGYSQKVAMLAHLPALIATRGSMALLPLFSWECGSKFQTFDDMVAGLVDTAQACASALESVIAKCGSSQIEIVAAGFSQTHNRPQAYLLQNEKGWTLSPIELAHVSPADDELKVKVAALGIDPAEPGHGHRLMREQHSRTWQLGGASISAVGGWCQIATVSKYGVSSRVLERWPL
jgi:hypothetical protein